MNQADSENSCERGDPLTHRLVRLPGVSNRRRRLIESLQSQLYDV
jgi:hypothetical protein